MKIGNGTGRVARWLLAAVMAFGVSTTAMAGVSTSKHNLGSGGPGPNTASDTAEICVFCHTPHAADVSVPGVPLWNKAFTTTSYTTYSSSTMDAIGTGAAGVVSIGSVSIACLSCHDGTQAMDNIRNAPGSGGFDATGGGAGGLTYSWTGADVMANTPSTLAMLGSDLSNDHPIGIQYCGGYTTVLGCKDTDFNAPATGTIGGATAFWVETTGSGVGRQKADMILYQRNFAANNGAYTAGLYPSVECASCHDPHNPTNGTFLRVANTGSAVCLACHIK
jgi:predicted CXXCH cytochrome family protein